MDISQTSAPDWGIAKRIAFRLAFCYLVLYISFDLLAIAVGGNLGSYLYKAYAKIWYPVVPWVGAHILHLKTPVDPVYLIEDGMGDTAFEYVQIFSFLLLAVLGTIAWTLIDRRTKNYREIHHWLRVYVRYVFAFVLLGYGMIKVIKTQFPFPGFSQLLTTYGNSSPFDLLWNFMGYSTAYTFFAGAVEILAAVLLFWRRTVTLGALVAVAGTLNVLMLNYCYDVTVKIASTHLLLLSLFLLAADLGRLANFFLLNRATAPVNLGPAVTSLSMSIVGGGLKFLIIAFAIYLSTKNSLTIHRMNEQAKNMPVYGMYEVEEFKFNGQLLPPLTTDRLRWQKVLFGPWGTGSPMSIVMMDNSLQTYFSARYDADKHTISIVTQNGKTKNILSYSRSDPDHLTIEGSFKADSVSVSLKKIDETKLPLVRSRFSWLNDQL